MSNEQLFYILSSIIGLLITIVAYFVNKLVNSQERSNEVVNNIKSELSILTLIGQQTKERIDSIETKQDRLFDKIDRLEATYTLLNQSSKRNFKLISVHQDLIKKNSDLIAQIQQKINTIKNKDG